ncbi:hypothetical protein D3C72_1536980 [compost metagenome]
MHDADELDALDAADTGHDRVFQLGLGAAVAKAVGVFLAIAEFQRILRHLGLRQGLVDATVEQILQPRLGRHLHMEAGLRDDPFVFLEIAVIHHLAGFRALDPEILRHFPAAQHRIDFRPNVVCDPVHL